MVNIEGNTRLVQINVDVQNDFCPGGSLAVTAGDEVVAPLNKLAQTVRETEGGLVVSTRDFHPEHTSHFGDGEGQWPVHCVAGTEGAEFHPDLDVDEKDLIVTKGDKPGEDAYSGFDGHVSLQAVIGDFGEDRGLRTSLEKALLNKMSYTDATVLIGGLATDYCVRATVLDALKLRKKTTSKIAVYALTDAMRAVNIQEADGAEALAEMEAAGAIMTTTDELIARIQKGEL